MKLIKNYINLLTKDKLEEFATSNNIILNYNELDYLYNLIKNNFENILTNEEYYFKELKDNITYDNYIKIKELYTYYKNRYKGYLI